MTLPIMTSVEDIEVVCKFLATKPTGITVADARAVIDKKVLDGRKLTALKTWGLIAPVEGTKKIKITPEGRDFIKNEGAKKQSILKAVIKRIKPYDAIIEYVIHKNETSLSADEAAAHWHEHFREDVGDNSKSIKEQVTCFMQLASGAGLGEFKLGRRGGTTRFDVASNIDEYLSESIENKGGSAPQVDITFDHSDVVEDGETDFGEENDCSTDLLDDNIDEDEKLGQAIFIAHGKNKKPLNQLKVILDGFKISYKVAVEEPNLGRPISEKVRVTMKECNCAILIFTADDKFLDSEGNEIWRPSENVVHELGAVSYLYENRVVIMKEKDVNFPTNFSDIGYISFEKDTLDAKAMDVLKELIGFGIVKIST